MSDSITLEPPVDVKTEEKQKNQKKAAAGRGGSRKGRRGGRGFGTEADQGGNSADDINRLIQMVKLIAQTLKLVVNHDPPLVPRELRVDFQRNWPAIERQFSQTIVRLVAQGPALRRKLEPAGLTGEMLEMKQRSLTYYLKPLNEAIESFGQTGKRNLVVTAPLSSQKSWLDFVDTVKKWFTPGSGAMNSILGSLAGAIPLVEGIKEFKDHVEAANAFAEANRQTMD